MKNYADPLRSDNSSYHTIAKFNNCIIINSKYFQSSEKTQNVFLKKGFSFWRRFFAKPIINEENIFE